MILNRERLAWAAGLVDGEGCFTTKGKYKSGLHKVKFAMAQKDPEVLWDFYGVVQVGDVYHAKNGYPGGIWKFEAERFENVQHIAALLWFQLGTVKRAQAYKVLLLAI